MDLRRSKSLKKWKCWGTSTQQTHTLQKWKCIRCTLSTSHPLWLYAHSMDCFILNVCALTPNAKYLPQQNERNFFSVEPSAQTRPPDNPTSTNYIADMRQLIEKVRKYVVSSKQSAPYTKSSMNVDTTGSDKIYKQHEKKEKKSFFSILIAFKRKKVLCDSQ